tara:strand:- start:239 stop:526 length:288 start_codon:yes stop_codon:yes gene_type:complete
MVSSRASARSTSFQFQFSSSTVVSMDGLFLQVLYYFGQVGSYLQGCSSFAWVIAPPPPPVAAQLQSFGSEALSEPWCSVVGGALPNNQYPLRFVR